MHHQNVGWVVLGALDGLLGHLAQELHLTDAVVGTTPGAVVSDVVADEHDRHLASLRFWLRRRPLALHC